MCLLRMQQPINAYIPISRGGTDEDSNLQPCCWVCNQLKGSLTDKEFRKYIKAIKTMHKLVKLKIVFPQRVELKFSQEYYPGYNHIK